MKLSKLIIFSLAFTGSAWAVELPMDLDVPSDASSSFVGEQKKELDVSLVDTKDQKIAHVAMKKISTGFLLLFESSKLPQSNFSLTIENGCGIRSATGAENSVKNEIRDIRIRGQFYSDEFKLKGYSLDEDGQKSLGGKVFKLYQVSKSNPPKQVACGKIE